MGSRLPRVVGGDRVNLLLRPLFWPPTRARLRPVRAWTPAAVRPAARSGISRERRGLGRPPPPKTTKHENVEDIHTIAASALTDGPDDKKCDFVYVDRDSGQAIIAQSYMASDESRAAAPANKASDLNTAVAWLLGRDLEVLPEGLKAPGADLHAALQDGEVTRLDIWYVHNLPESTQVQAELSRVQNTAAGLLRTNYPDAKVDVVVQEIGRTRLDEWYASTQIPVLVSNEFVLDVGGGFEESGDKWRAFCTSVPAGWLRELYSSYGADLFSANVRGYLGSRRSDRNINHNIKETARLLPERFWAYNNGLTALVNGFTFDGDRLSIQGISIVNGAQTTGALGSVSSRDGESLSDAKILARFVECSDQEVIRDIIRFNNSQNRIEAADFRSNDVIQERLRSEFRTIPDAEYRGGRRGSDRDIIARPPNLIPTDTVAQALAAFHQEPNVAYNEKSRIWASDEVYARFFSDRTRARHILFAYSLVRAIEEAKANLLRVPEQERTASQRTQIAFFRQRGSIFLLASAIAECIEVYIGRAVPDAFALRFRKNVSPREATALWRPIVEPSLAFVEQLSGALERNLKNRDKVTEAISRFKSLVEATKGVSSKVFADFAGRVSHQ